MAFLWPCLSAALQGTKGNETLLTCVTQHDIICFRIVASRRMAIESPSLCCVRAGVVAKALAYSLLRTEQRAKTVQRLGLVFCTLFWFLRFFARFTMFQPYLLSNKQFSICSCVQFSTFIEHLQDSIYEKAKGVNSSLWQCDKELFSLRKKRTAWIRVSAWQEQGSLYILNPPLFRP